MNEISAEPTSMSFLLMSPARKLADSNVAMANCDDSADMAIRLMKERQTKCVLLSRGGEAVGIVTKTDILFKVLSQGKNPSKVRLEEIMNTPIIAVDPAATVQEALSIMDKHAIRQIVVSSNSSVLGIISRDDLFEREQLTTTAAENTALQGTPVCIINPEAVLFSKDDET
jgi:CBS domain-containing protein